MKSNTGFSRREFIADAAVLPVAQAGAGQPRFAASPYPRRFSGRALSQIAFPLGGIGAGSISLGGRGELRDWEIFNRSHKGNAPKYCFASIWAKAEGGAPIARVLEARFQPPYGGANGLGYRNVPGLPRLATASFTGEFPIARVAFQDRDLPVRVSLEAFTPFVPLDEEASGLPVAILRYRVKNTNRAPASVSIAYSLRNPVGDAGRINDFRTETNLSGLLMHNPFLASSDPLKGTFALGAMDAAGGELTHLRGWPLEMWGWTPALLFWDDFSSDGRLDAEAAKLDPAGSLCLRREIAPGAEASYTFVLAWHFPNRTPERCGWAAPQGEEKTVIGNYYCTRFRDAWDAARHLATNLPDLERRTKAFTKAVRESTLPAEALDAAMSNLSTLVTPTSFRTSDGRFHGFEGTNDQGGCCHGSCTHVWNYETATDFLFPALARSRREASFSYLTRESGQMAFREVLPFRAQEGGTAAADGQMGQIVKLYLDWQLSGDNTWLRKLWPVAKRALSFAWIPGGWDGDRDGVMEGVQHNTYDVEFFGPNPLCGVWYLGALRAGEEMARAMGDDAFAAECRRLFENGSRWFDAHLFNGEYYIQKIRGMAKDQIAKGTGGGSTADPTKPDFQLGEGCLVDQLVGQYLATVAGLGPLLKTENIRKTARSIWKYNFKPDLFRHEAVQRVYALNDEAGLVICDYSSGKRPRIPFPYFAELMTGFEYSAAILMLQQGMLKEGLEAIAAIRRRYDGERRNPWDEAECGHHYARAMASWSGVVTLSGFAYSGVAKSLTLRPLLNQDAFRCFWSAPSSWGTFEQSRTSAGHRIKVTVVEGALACRSIGLGMEVSQVVAKLQGRTVPCAAKGSLIAFAEEIRIHSGAPLEFTVEGARTERRSGN
jgi:non-lysosomal glucosylceramidase